MIWQRVECGDGIVKEDFALTSDKSYRLYAPLLLSLILFIQFSGVAQPWANSTDQYQDYKLSVVANGLIFDENVLPLSFLPGDQSILANIGVWISATDQSNNLHVSVNSNHKSGYDFWPGPIDTLTGLALSPFSWDKAYMVSSAAIYYHRNHWQDQGYQMADEIANWPGNGTNGAAQHLAPYYDYNLNGIYDPEQGDFPMIRGEKAIYTISNDVFGEHKISGGAPLKLELHTELSFKKLNNGATACYISWGLVNESTNNYSDLYFGVYIKGVLGNPNDNRMRTWVDQNGVVLYNGDELDEGPGGFQDKIPYALLRFVNTNLSSTLLLNPTSVNSDSIPTYDQGFRNVNLGLWASGESLKYGMDGVSGTEVTNYMFAGATDPENNGVWTEESAAYPKGKRNVLMNSGPFVLAPKGSLKVQLGLATGFLTKTDPTEVKDVMSMLQEALSNTKVKPLENISVYPNPVNGNNDIYVVSEKGLINSVEIRDLQGRLIQGYNNLKLNRFQCNISEVGGVYILKVNVGSEIIQTKVLVK